MRIGIPGEWMSRAIFHLRKLQSRNSFFSVLFLVCALIGYGPEWLPHYFNVFKDQPLSLLGRLSSYRSDCSIAPRGDSICSDFYTLPAGMISFGIDRAIGIGMIAGDIEYGCYDQFVFHPSGVFGVVGDPGKLTNQYRQYRVISFGELKCADYFAIAVFTKQRDARHGYFSGVVIDGRASEIADYQKLQDFFSNILPLAAALVGLIAVSIAYMLRRFVQNKKQLNDLLEIVWFKAIAAIFGAGIIQILLPISGLALFYRKYNNYFLMMVLLLVMKFYSSRRSGPKLLNTILDLLITPFLFRNIQMIRRFFTLGSLLMCSILLADNWSMIYVYRVVPLVSMLVIITGLFSYEALLFAVLSISGDLKLLNIVWGPGSDVISYYIMGLIIYELHRILRNEIDLNISSSINRFLHERDATSHILHDIKSPIGVLRLLLSQISWKPDQSEVKEIFVESVSKIQHLSRNYLVERSMERIEFVYLRKSRLEKIFRACSKFNDIVIKKIVLDDFEVPLLIGSIEFDRILTNLISNSYEARNVSCVHVIGRIINDGFYQLIVTNDGDSVPSSILKKIISVGTTFGKEGGTGFGIQSVKRIIEESGGTFSFESSNNVNVAFVTIPIAKNLTL